MTPSSPAGCGIDKGGRKQGKDSLAKYLSSLWAEMQSVLLARGS